MTRQVDLMKASFHRLASTLSVHLGVGLGFAGFSSLAQAQDGSGLLQYAPLATGVPAMGGFGLAILSGALAFAAHRFSRRGGSAGPKALVMMLWLGAASAAWFSGVEVIRTAAAPPTVTELSQPEGGEVPVPIGHMEYKNTSGVQQRIVKIQEPECRVTARSSSAPKNDPLTCAAGQTLLADGESCQTEYCCTEGGPYNSVCPPPAGCYYDGNLWSFEWPGGLGPAVIDYWFNATCEGSPMYTSRGTFVYGPTRAEAQARCTDNGFSGAYGIDSFTEFFICS